MQSAEFKTMSPASLVPALVDGDFKLFDSSAMSIYFVEKYGKDDSLYPKDPEKRAKVNEKLFFVSSAMFPIMLQALRPIFFGITSEISPECLVKYRSFYSIIENMMEDKYWAGPEMTLADIFLWSVMESWIHLEPLTAEKHPKFTKWLETMRQHPCGEYQQQGGKEHIDLILGLAEENRKNLRSAEQ